MLTNDDDDVVDEETGEGPVDEAADEPARGAREAGTLGEGALSPELEKLLRSFEATQGWAGVGDEEGGEDEVGADKRESTTAGEEREGETGERAGKNTKRRGGTQKRKHYGTATVTTEER